MAIVKPKTRSVRAKTPRVGLRDWFDSQEEAASRFWYRMLDVAWLRDSGVWPIRNIPLVLGLALLAFGLLVLAITLGR